MIHYSTIVVDNLTPNNEYNNNIFFEIVEDIKHKRKKLKCNDIPLNWYNLQKHNEQYTNNKIFITIIPCLKTTTHFMEEKKENSAKNIDVLINKKNVQFSNKNNYMLIPTRDEFKELKEFLFWSDSELHLFRKRRIFYPEIRK